MHRKQISFKKTTHIRRIYGKEETGGGWGGEKQKKNPTKLNNLKKKKIPTAKQKRNIIWTVRAWRQRKFANSLGCMTWALPWHMYESTSFHLQSLHTYIALPGHGPRNTLTLKLGEVYQGVGVTSTLRQNGMCFCSFLTSTLTYCFQLSKHHCLQIVSAEKQLETKISTVLGS